MTDLGNQRKKKILPSEKVCVWVGVGVAEAPQPHSLRSLCMSGGFQPMGSNAINPCYINPCFINRCFLSPVHVLPVQSLLYDVAHKSKIEITRENDGEGARNKGRFFPSPRPPFLTSYLTKH